ncbi:unnamed protein product [Rotaria sp. Silwood1]|nr:unnamed protein product [Rotaria sp. Silwood1]
MLAILIRGTYRFIINKWFTENEKQNDGKQYKCWSSSFNWDFKLMHIYKRLLSFFNHRHDQHKQIII